MDLFKDYAGKEVKVVSRFLNSDGEYIVYNGTLLKNGRVFIQLSNGELYKVDKNGEISNVEKFRIIAINKGIVAYVKL